MYIRIADIPESTNETSYGRISSRIRTKMNRTNLLPN
jgi:hypothetical protein